MSFSTRLLNIWVNRAVFMYPKETRIPKVREKFLVDNLAIQKCV